VSDRLTLAINGQLYTGWTSVRVTRSIENAASEFDIAVTERWADSSQPTPWQIKPFDACTIAIDGTAVLTGYVERYEPSYSKDAHGVRVAGRSKTCDLVDCMPAFKGGQFNGYTLDRIVRAFAQPFGITVDVQANVGAAFPAIVLEKSETAHAALSRLCRMRGVLACDDANGNLVICQAGTGKTTAALVEGQNILAASAKLAVNERFATYVVIGQAPLAFDGQDVQTQVVASASDSGVPRPRRFAEHAEHAADTGAAQMRATWRARHNLGKSLEATVTVQGWEQADGSLFDINQLAPLNSPRLEINRTLLVGKVSYLLDDHAGTRTELVLAPQEAYTPEPLSIKAGKGTNVIWTG
jgi:prophage tail gpP-like protein